MKRAIHPLLLAIYPVLALLAFNITEAKPADALRALLVSLASGIVLFIVLKLVLRNTQRAALVFSTLWVLFFSYGHVYDSLGQIRSLGSQFARHRFLIPAWVAVFLAASAIMARKRASARSMTPVLNVMGLAALLMPIL